MLKLKELEQLYSEIEQIEKDALKFEKNNKKLIKNLHKTHQKSGKNLLHYLSLRSLDIRETQIKLSEIGLSRLANCEANTLNSVLKVKEVLQHILKQK